jgi:outer membrane protein assembly factor BamE (lipoprotein component of BamABCDE complex)
MPQQFLSRSTVSAPRLRPCLCAVLVAGLLAGCTGRVETHGVPLDQDLAGQIRPGVHGRADVARLLGSPSSTSLFSDEAWYYIGDQDETIAFLNRTVTERKVLTVRFDPSGTVTAVEQFGLERSQDVELVERETPSFGESMNAVQQIIGNLGRFNKADTQPPR